MRRRENSETVNTIRDSRIAAGTHSPHWKRARRWAQDRDHGSPVSKAWMSWIVIATGHRAAGKRVSMGQ